MNERIRQLAVQAEMEANKGDHVEVKLMMEKFAELIVQECAKTIEDVHSKDLGDYLKDVFGVEE